MIWHADGLSAVLYIYIMYVCINIDCALMENSLVLLTITLCMKVESAQKGLNV